MADAVLAAVQYMLCWEAANSCSVVLCDRMPPGLDPLQMAGPQRFERPTAQPKRMPHIPCFCLIIPPPCRSTTMWLQGSQMPTPTCVSSR